MSNKDSSYVNWAECHSTSS